MMMHFNPKRGRTGKYILFINGIASVTAYLKDVEVAPREASTHLPDTITTLPAIQRQRAWYLEYRDNISRLEFNDLEKLDLEGQGLDLINAYKKFHGFQHEAYKLLVEQIQPATPEELLSMKLKDICEHPRIKPQPMSPQQAERKTIHDYELNRRRQAGQQMRKEMNGTLGKDYSKAEKR